MRISMPLGVAPPLAKRTILIIDDLTGPFQAHLARQSDDPSNASARDGAIAALGLSLDDSDVSVLPAIG